MAKYTVERTDSYGLLTKALPLARAEKRAGQFAAKSPHLGFVVKDHNGIIMTRYGTAR